MKIALIGYGKMGHEIEKVALDRGHKIVCTIDAGEEEKFFSEEFKLADVVIEFTSPESAYNNYIRAFEAGIPVVSGTTGWLDRMDDIKRECKDNGKTFFYASNFSLGVNIFFALNRYLAKVMDRFAEYDVDIDETHHIHKLDAPSGTAITLAEDIISELKRKNEWEVRKCFEDESVYGTNSINPGDCNKNIIIRSHREGEIPGIHTVTYSSEADSISISHDAKSRKGFALGAVLAAEFTVGKKGFLGMKDMLGDL
ncbi:MAG: 4-hydroxy-tetrahydrodipicolinate reductase [Fermentimonas sp.]|jgi:4-hydroxy-tetrahydrodipicolinate reductase